MGLGSMTLATELRYILGRRGSTSGVSPDMGRQRTGLFDAGAAYDHVNVKGIPFQQLRMQTRQQGHGNKDPCPKQVGNRSDDGSRIATAPKGSVSHCLDQNPRNLSPAFVRHVTKGSRRGNRSQRLLRLSVMPASGGRPRWRPRTEPARRARWRPQRQRRGRTTPGDPRARQ